MIKVDDGRELEVKGIDEVELEKLLIVNLLILKLLIHCMYQTWG